MKRLYIIIFITLSIFVNSIDNTTDIKKIIIYTFILNKNLLMRQIE